MASFFPHFKKKQLQHLELEAELMVLLQKGAGEEDAHGAAEAVRRARRGALKTAAARLAQSEKNARDFDEMRRGAEALQGTSAAVILDEYRRRVASPNRLISISRAPRQSDG